LGAVWGIAPKMKGVSSKIKNTAVILLFGNEKFTSMLLGFQQVLDARV
jgi:hypothetical protein